MILVVFLYFAVGHLFFVATDHYGSWSEAVKCWLLWPVVMIVDGFRMVRDTFYGRDLYGRDQGWPGAALVILNLAAPVVIVGIIAAVSTGKFFGTANVLVRADGLPVYIGLLGGFWLVAVFAAGDRAGLSRLRPKPEASAPTVGQNVLVRTVGYHAVGRLDELSDDWLVLSSASYLGDTGRYSQALHDGLEETEHAEIEVVGGTMWVNRGVVCDVVVYRHPLPTKTK